MSLRHFVLFKDLVDDLWPYLNRYFDGWEERKKLTSSTISDGEFLWRELEEQSVAPEASLKEFQAFALARSFLKKFEDVTSRSADTVALDKFLQSNLRCKDWRLGIQDSGEELLLGLFKQRVWEFFNPSNLHPLISNVNQIMVGTTVGPGASIGARGTDFYTKLFSSPLTCTSGGIYEMYSHYLCKLPDWSRAEQLRLEQYGEPEIVPGNRLTFVPKNADTSRVICVEPNLNMFIQQGIRAILERRLIRYFGIDLENQQDVNRELARIGSSKDSYCTIDLSAASDSVSMSMLRSTFPRDVVMWLDFVRSPSCVLPNGSIEPLYMVSSMGNATTFPLETIIFACAVSAAYDSLDKKLVKGYRVNSKFNRDNGAFEQTTRLPNFGVFGDDLIVEKDAYQRVVKLLNLLGFSVNAEKSFSQGPFRESCGGDYFRGLPTRGIYVKSLKTPASRYVAINRLNQWTSMTGIPVRRVQRRLIKSVRYLPVPLYEDDDAGIKVPFDLVKPGFKHVIRDENFQSYSYRKWSSYPRKIKLKDGAIKLPRGAKSRIYNPSALLLAFLRGDIEAESISIRLGAARYSSRVAVAPNWDYEPTVMDGIAPVRGQTRLATACRINLE